MASRNSATYSLLEKDGAEENRPERKTHKGFIDLRNFRYHWIDSLMAVVLWLIGGTVQYIGKPFHRFFTERDPTMSYPYVTAVQVPTWLLFTLAWIVPATVILIAQYLLFRRFGAKVRAFKVAKFFLAQMVLFQALGLTLFLTSLSKVFFGRQRPNFYAFCNYKGYREAVETGNYESYLSKTIAGEPGDISFCEASEGEINESMFSHPSGHASLSFCGLGFLSLFLLQMLLSHKPTKRHHLWKAMVFTVPMFIAVIVAATRTRDYWHNYDDTVMGGLLGFGCASLMFSINYKHEGAKSEYVGNLFSQVDDDDELAQSELGVHNSHHYGSNPPHYTPPNEA